MTNLIKDIAQALRDKYPEAEIDVEYDYHPVEAESILHMVEILRESDEVGDWVVSGDAIILRSTSDGEERVDVVLLKRGVVIEMEFPQSLKGTANGEVS